MDYSPPGSSVHGDSPGNTEVGCYALLQGIFPTQRLNPGLLQCRQILYCLSIQGRTGSSVQFSRSVVSDSLPPQGLQHARPPCPLPTPEFTQTHAHWVGDAIQPFHPVVPFSSSLQFSQHQGLFKWVSSSHQVAKVLEFQLQHQSFQWICRTDFLEDALVGSPCSPRDSQESSPTPQFKCINSSALCILIVQLSHPYI